MNIPFVDLKAQYSEIKEEIHIAVSNVINEFAFINGPYAKKFENEFAAKQKVKYCIGVGNGTDALFLALKTIGVCKGDEVITAANSFIATSEAITLSGAKVVFCDVHPETYNLDINRLENLINRRTKAIIPVHLYGQPCDMSKIKKIAKENNLFVIEDAAQAHLAEHKNKIVGGIGDIGCFSFYPGKNLGAYGDAGAIVTNNDRFAQRARMLANHGRISKYDHEFEGMNSRMDGIQGAILSVKLKYLKKWTDARINVAKVYKKHLSNLKEIKLPKQLPENEHVYHLFVIRVTERNKLQKYLVKKKIATGIHYPKALPNLSAYKYLNKKPSDFPVATKYQDEILSLPMYPELDENKIEYIAKCIRGFYNV